MEKIKSMFSKESMTHFFLKHGEKVAMSFVLLFVVMAVFGTNWNSTEKKPEILVNNLKDTGTKIEQSQWPEEEKSSFEVEDVRSLVKAKMTPLNPQPINVVIAPFFPENGETEPFREPTLIAVAKLVATPGRAPIPLRDLTTDAEETTKEEEKKDEPEIFENPDFAPRTSLTASAPGEQPYPGGEGYGTSSESYYAPEEYQDPYADYYGGEEGSGEYPGGGVASAGLPEGVTLTALRYVSVRGIIDLRSQISAFEKALNVPYESAEQMLQYLDFKLQRQVADPTREDPWSVEWEDVDLDVAVDILERSLDYDPDIVASSVRHPVFTMPLPGRLLGIWQSQVTHPDVENFTLSPEEMEAELILTEKILEEYRKQKKTIKTIRGQGGFSTTQHNTQQIMTEYTESRPNQRNVETMLTELTDDKAKRSQIQKQIESRLSAAGNVYLFRYIDFDVDPGRRYKYRVQLELRNPNFGRQLTEVEHPSVAEGETRFTPWSNPTDPIRVEDDVYFFVKDISQPRGVNEAQAKVDIYEYYTETGTLVAGDVTIEPGQIIGGKTKADLLRPDKLTFDLEDVTLGSNDILIDVEVFGRLNRQLHSDIQFPNNRSIELNTVDKLLVLNDQGELNVIDEVSQQRELDRQKKQKEQQDSHFLELKNKPKPGEGGELDALLGSEEGYDPYAASFEGALNNFGRNRRRNSSRR